jgi:hypothetical protein
MRDRSWFYIAAVVAGVISPAGVMAVEYSNPKAAMLEAIDAPAGRVSGVLRGPVADQFAGTTKSTAPVEINVTTIKSFKQEGCKRLNVRLKQANVPTKDGKLTEFGVDYGINLCRDGSPPTEGMDLEKVGKALGAVSATGTDSH